MDLRYVRSDGWGASAGASAASRVTFLKKVYGLFTASVFLSALGAMCALYAGTSFSHVTAGHGARQLTVPPLVAFFAQHPFISMGIALGSVFGASAVRHRPGLNVAALFGMATILGVVFAPALFVAQLMAGLGGTLSASPVRDAFILSVAAFGGLTAYAMLTKRDFSFMGGALVMGVFVVFGASLLNLFLGSSIFGLAISSVAVLLFGAYVLYDTSRLLRSNEDDAVGGAISLYLDFVNLFLAILRILSSRRD
jgi:modulator of FtsH protease